MLNNAPLYSLNSGRRDNWSAALGRVGLRTPCVEPVTCEEHGEEEDDHRVFAQCYRKSHDLGFP